MADVRPIQALRYRSDLDLTSVTAPPYDVLSKNDRDRLAERSPYNVVHVDLPEGEGDTRYENAKHAFGWWRKQGDVVRAPAPAIYVYSQTFGAPGAAADARRITRTGFFALVRAEPYATRAVLPHERTLSGPKEDRYKLFRATRTALSPVFLLYRDTTRALRNALVHSTDARKWRTDDGIDHALTEVTDPSVHAAIAVALKHTPLLIADGHHRYETAVRVSEELDTTVSPDEHASGDPASAPHRFALAFLCDGDDPGLQVFPTHRVARGLGAFDRGDFVQELSREFDVRPLHHNEALEDALDPKSAAPTFVVRFKDGETVAASLRDTSSLLSHPYLAGIHPALRSTDLVVLHKLILEKLLHITKEDEAAGTKLSYAKTTAATIDLLAADGVAAFFVRSTPVPVVRSVCEAGEVMPQKSTYFFTKIPTGVLFHSLD